MDVHPLKMVLIGIDPYPHKSIVHELQDLPITPIGAIGKDAHHWVPRHRHSQLPQNMPTPARADPRVAKWSWRALPLCQLTLTISGKWKNFIHIYIHTHIYIQRNVHNIYIYVYVCMYACMQYIELQIYVAYVAQLAWFAVHLLITHLTVGWRRRPARWSQCPSLLTSSPDPARP